MFYIFTYLTTLPNGEKTHCISWYNKRKWRHKIALYIHKVAVFSHDMHIYYLHFPVLFAKYLTEIFRFSITMKRVLFFILTMGDFHF